jgi:hypothetical protein
VDWRAIGWRWGSSTVKECIEGAALPHQAERMKSCWGFGKLYNVLERVARDHTHIPISSGWRADSVVDHVVDQVEVTTDEAQAFLCTQLAQVAQMLAQDIKALLGTRAVSTLADCALLRKPCKLHKTGTLIAGVEVLVQHRQVALLEISDAYPSDVCGAEFLQP